MSQYDKLTGGKHLRVRGNKPVTFAAVMKALAVNIARAVTVKRARMQASAPHQGGRDLSDPVILLFKERFGRQWRAISLATVPDSIPVPLAA